LTHELDQQHQHASIAVIGFDTQSNGTVMQCKLQMAKSTQLFIHCRSGQLAISFGKVCRPLSASDEKEAARLQHLASPEGKAEFTDWVGGPRRSLLEVLLAFPSCKPSLGVATTQ